MANTLDLSEPDDGWLTVTFEWPDGTKKDVRFDTWRLNNLFIGGATKLSDDADANAKDEADAAYYRNAANAVEKLGGPPTSEFSRKKLFPLIEKVTALAKAALGKEGPAPQATNSGDSDTGTDRT